MRTLFIAAYAANVALAIASRFLLPERVAIHFGRGGLANAWAPRDIHMLLSLGTDTFLFVLLFLTPALINRVPARWVNLPNRDYWLADANRGIALARIRHSTAQFGTAVLLFLLAVNVLSIAAHRCDPVRLNEPAFLALLALFFLFMGLWCIQFIRDFRIPLHATSTSAAARMDKLP